MPNEGQRQCMKRMWLGVKETEKVNEEEILVGVVVAGD